MKKILVIEDDPFIRDISTIKLTEHGYTVVAAPDGTTALQRLSETIFDVALLDLDSPDSERICFKISSPEISGKSRSRRATSNIVSESL